MGLQRRLELAAYKIEYWQKRNAASYRYHRKKRRLVLLALGVDFDTLVRCPPWPILVQLDLGPPPVRDPFDRDVSL